MKIFDFDWAANREIFQQQGWVHVKGGLDADFYEFVRRHVAEVSKADLVTGRGIKGERTSSCSSSPTPPTLIWSSSTS